MISHSTRTSFYITVIFKRMSSGGNDVKTVRSKRVELALDKVFFEKQDGALCGQHCLNNAVQCRMFTAVDLSTIAQQLDEQERLRMAERGTDTQEYRDFLNKPSDNFDDTGYFGVQVLAQALKNLGLDLVSFNSNDSRAARARTNPVEQRIIICNMEDHWFAMRRFGNQWVNLNSFLGKPEPITDSYFTLYLTTLQNDGYNLFFVFGNAPENAEADAAFENIFFGTDEFSEDTIGPGMRLGGGSAEVVQENQQSNTSRSEAIRVQREAFLMRLQANQDKQQQ
ncbi:unnamed protein product [Allacma fusca]|uniref:ubiquitinyl hydrolase 1 n=1 Tax=Allacma fusca TaxID=39272 RepID=A0A8J2P2X4_9HEXA|nr:unnamed protein product [Allacma fusca]